MSMHGGFIVKSSDYTGASFMSSFLGVVTVIFCCISELFRILKLLTRLCLVKSHCK